MTNQFVATLEDLYRFLEAYQDDLFYFNLNPSGVPSGARGFDITTFPANIAERVIEDIHTHPTPARLTPQAAAKIAATPQKPPPTTVKLECGMNIQPTDGIGYRFEPIFEDLKKVGWVRFPFTSSPVRFSSLEAAFQFYDSVVKLYNDWGVKIIVVFNHETYGEAAGYSWDRMDAPTWARYRSEFLGVFQRIVQRYGDKIQAYEIWNEGDVLVGNPAAVHFPPREYAPLLDQCEKLVRRHAPEASVVLGGLVRGPDIAADYVRQIKSALGGRLPLDAIGYHPYGKGAPNDNTVFSRFGKINDDIRIINQAAPNVPLWLTEVGALGTDNPDFWDDAALYMNNLYSYLRTNQAEKTPVVIWYAWSDAMDTAQKTNGVVTKQNQKKPFVYDTFFQQACR